MTGGGGGGYWAVLSLTSSSNLEFNIYICNIYTCTTDFCLKLYFMVLIFTLMLCLCLHPQLYNQLRVSHAQSSTKIRLLVSFEK